MSAPIDVICPSCHAERGNLCHLGDICPERAQSAALPFPDDPPERTGFGPMDRDNWKEYSRAKRRWAEGERTNLYL